MTENIVKVKKKILLSILDILPYEPFDSNIISKACLNISLQKEYGNLLFPNGRMEILEALREYVDNLMLKRIDKELTEINSITQRIYQTIKIRLEILSEHKIAISKIISFFLNPFNHIKLYSYIWHSMNLIWHAAGKDSTTDFNYYTKRFLLSGIYCSVLLYWISDESEEHKETYDFLNRKLQLITNIGRKLNSNKS